MAAAVVVGASTSWLASAQNAEPAGGAATAQPGATSTSGVLEEVIVTAQKRAENLQDVPISISVVRGDSLVSSGAIQLTDFAGYVPGLQVDNSGTPGRSTVSIRGIAAISNATTGTYLDDAPVGSSSMYARNSEYSLDLLPYDIEHIVRERREP